MKRKATGCLDRIKIKRHLVTRFRHPVFVGLDYDIGRRGVRLWRATLRIPELWSIAHVATDEITEREVADMLYESLSAGLRRHLRLFRRGGRDASRHR